MFRLILVRMTMSRRFEVMSSGHFGVSPVSLLFLTTAAALS